MILVHVTTVPETLGFFRGQIGFMKARGMEVHAVSSPGVLLHAAAVREQIPVHAVDLHRRITPWSDLEALARLYGLFRGLQPAIVHAHTPKGGLLGVLAARLARVPVVLYGMRGLPFVTHTGLKRRILCWTETAACRLAHRVIAVSQGVRRTAVNLGFCPEDKIRVLAQGSGNGVDARERFNPQTLPAGLRNQTRELCQIPPDALVMGYMGRIVRDKGIIELEAAWQTLRTVFPGLHLLLVGPIEPQDPIPAPVLRRLQEDPRVRLTGGVRDSARYYTAMDLLVLPTYREGFPNTPLEAAAMELPVVATTVDGCVEAVVDGITGLLVPPRESAALAAAVQNLLDDAEMRTRMGRAARQRVLRDFRPEVIWQALYDNYLELLKARGCL